MLLKFLSISKTARYWFSFSSVLIVLSFVAMGVWGLRPGIDFVGGSIMEVRGQNATVVSIRTALEKNNQKSIEVQSTGNNSVQVRMQQLDNDQHTKLLADLLKEFPGLEELRFDSVGPIFSKDLVFKSILAIVLSSFGILIYLAFVFNKSSAIVSSWAFGIFAVVALIHDVVIIAGFFAVYAHYFSASADSLFVSAILTVIGFSVHDTIVIYNRVKSNLRILRLPFGELVDLSVLETFTRSVNTSVTTLLVLLSLLFFGGSTIRPFVATLCFGIILGSYSSVFVAAPLLVWWQERNKKKK
ncbi:MAG: protein translocase subunit SecF [bacterium]|nr:protein translocase subunit SecF [bacterium]